MKDQQHKHQKRIITSKLVFSECIETNNPPLKPKVLVIVSSLFLLASIMMLILSTVPEFQVNCFISKTSLA